MTIPECKKQDEELRRPEMKELAAANKLYKEKIAEEKHKKQTRKKVVKDQTRTEKQAAIEKCKAERVQQKKVCNNQKTIQSLQRGNSTATNASVHKKKPAHCVVGVYSQSKPAMPDLPACTYKTYSNCTATCYIINLYRGNLLHKSVE
jgi:hypothetical protein